MRTDSFTILVGPNQSAYKILEGRLTMHSSVFSRMCCAPFLESTQRVINLPEENPRVFHHFYDWMHSSKPHVDLGMGTEAIFDLAIFAEKHQSCHLTNQISDLLGEKWSNYRPSTQILDRVYSSVPDGAVLRQLCASILDSIVNKDHSSISAFDFEGMYEEYEPLFLLHSDLDRGFLNVRLLQAISFLSLARTIITGPSTAP